MNEKERLEAATAVWYMARKKELEGLREKVKIENFFEKYEKLEKEIFKIELTGRELISLFNAMRETEISMDIGFDGHLYHLVKIAKNVLEKAVPIEKVEG